MGYGGSVKDAGEAIGKSGDGGIDGIIKEDKLGLDIIYIQAKKWENAVPIKEIRDFAGALLGKKARKGIFLTTSSFAQSAIDFVRSIEHKIILIDGVKLAQLMVEYGVGVSTKITLEIKKVDSDYFIEE
jgi:restriction system protein